ncbi:hypothetical protein SEA_ORCANUS_8 [Arthrobacter phage Orcanus]|nr:hypothetical protein SEA_ORCANUS_8 [Arthrobacter phage Orcanus]WAB09118.1 hypothetical protein SEA_EESA_8 [Arthrobacter phage Eesa]
MALKKYSVKVNDYTTVLQLSDEDAKKRGLTEKDLFKPAGKSGTKAAAAPANKAAAAPADK